MDRSYIEEKAVKESTMLNLHPCFPTRRRRELLYGTCQVRNIEFDKQDVMTLVNASKTSASIIDAYFALCQTHVEVNGDTDWYLFLSRLGPLVSGEKPEGRVYGMIKDRALAAVSSSQERMLQ